jgi:hypothetical protein
MLSLILLTEFEGRDKTSASGSGKKFYEAKGLISPPPISFIHFHKNVTLSYEGRTESHEQQFFVE